MTRRLCEWRCWWRTRHQWVYVVPGYQRECFCCGRMEGAQLVDLGMNKLWFRLDPAP